MPMTFIDLQDLLSGQSAIMTVVDSTDLAALGAAIMGTGVLGIGASGALEVTASATTMCVDVAPGNLQYQGTEIPFSAGATAVQINGGATYSGTDRRDTVVFDTLHGNIQVRTGTACGTSGWTASSFPALPPRKVPLASTDIALAEVSLPNGTSSLTTVHNVRDMTCWVLPTPLPPTGSVVQPGTSIAVSTLNNTTNLVGSNPNRRQLWIYNNANYEVLYLALRASAGTPAAVANSGIRVNPNGDFWTTTTFLGYVDGVGTNILGIETVHALVVEV